MRLAEPLVKTLTDDLGVVGDNAADHRVRLDEPFAPGGQFQRPTHVQEVDFVLVHAGVGSNNECRIVSFSRRTCPPR